MVLVVSITIPNHNCHRLTVPLPGVVIVATFSLLAPCSFLIALDPPGSESLPAKPN